jgi:hypothetical protein
MPLIHWRRESPQLADGFAWRRQSPRREIVARQLAVVAGNSGLEYRGTPIEFLNEPQTCSAPPEPRYATTSDIRDVGHCGDIKVTIYEKGVPSERRFGLCCQGLFSGVEKKPQSSLLSLAGFLGRLNAGYLDCKSFNHNLKFCADFT